MDKVILVGGGTGGHCIPMVSMYKKFSKLNVKCQIITDIRGSVFFKEVSKNDVTIVRTTSKLITKIEQLINFPIIFLQTIVKMMSKQSIHIIGFGGYFTLPVLLSAKITNKDISVHEANAVMGKANRILSRYVENIFLTFNETKMIDEKFNFKIHIVGLPLRDEFENFSTVENNKYTITVIGGSQGSNSLSNEVSMGIIKFSKKINLELLVYHQCRPEDEKLIKNSYYNSNIKSEVGNYFIDMPKKIYESDIIISRSGSSTINEIIYANKPSILIPYPFAVDNHQFHNADVLQRKSCAKIIKNSDLSRDLLFYELLSFYDNPDKINSIKHRLKELVKKDTSERILDLIRN